MCDLVCFAITASFFSLCKIKRVRKDGMQHTNPGNSASFPGVSDTFLTSSLCGGSFDLLDVCLSSSGFFDLR